MKVRYYPDTDSLYIDLAERAGTEAVEVAPGVMADFDKDGRLVGLDIDQASKVADLSCLELDSVPSRSVVAGGGQPGPRPRKAERKSAKPRSPANPRRRSPAGTGTIARKPARSR